MRLGRELLANGGGQAGFEGAIETISATGSSFTEAPLPPGGTVGSLQSVACTSVSACTAVGEYGNAYGQGFGLIESLDGGGWTPTQAPTPPDGAGALLTQVACPSTGSCVAVGAYRVPPDNSPGPALLETLSSGTWTATTAPLPPDAGGGLLGPSLKSVSCPAVGSCVVVGNYFDGTGASEGLIETLTDGTWIPSDGPLPSGTPSPNSPAGLSSVSCSTATSCVAVGTYGEESDPLGLVDTLTGTSWTATDVRLPPKATYASLSAVDCGAGDSCIAVGVHGPHNLGYAERVWREVWTATDVPTP